MPLPPLASAGAKPAEADVATRIRQAELARRASVLSSIETGLLQARATLIQARSEAEGLAATASAFRVEFQ